MSAHEKLVSATRFVRITDDGVPPTNQTQSGKLPQKTIDNMVSKKKQQANEKAAAAKAAKAKAAAAKSAKESEIANRNQDTSMLEGGHESTTSLGKRKATPQDNTGHEGTRTSVTHMGIDGMEVPSMGGMAERQTGTQLPAPMAELGSYLAASAAAETDFATAAQAASIAPEVG
jgi:hypothetical protein